MAYYGYMYINKMHYCNGLHLHPLGMTYPQNEIILTPFHQQKCPNIRDLMSLLFVAFIPDIYRSYWKINKYWLEPYTGPLMSCICSLWLYWYR